MMRRQIVPGAGLLAHGGLCRIVSRTIYPEYGIDPDNQFAIKTPGY